MPRTRRRCACCDRGGEDDVVGEVGQQSFEVVGVEGLEPRLGERLRIRCRHRLIVTGVPLRCNDVVHRPRGREWVSGSKWDGRRCRYPKTTALAAG